MRGTRPVALVIMLMRNHVQFVRQNTASRFDQLTVQNRYPSRTALIAIPSRSLKRFTAGESEGGPAIYAGPPSTRIIVVGSATSARASITDSASRMSRSRASCVIITTGTASAVARPFWIIDAIEM